MDTQSPLEGLSNELFDSILAHLNAPQELSNFSQTSRAIYPRVIPKLYHSWSFHGLKHTRNSLRIFVDAILWHPELAAHVQILDLREWCEGDRSCPRLEDNLGSRYWDEEAPEDTIMKDVKPENIEQKECSWDGDGYDEEADGDYEPSEDGMSDETEEESDFEGSINSESAIDYVISEEEIKDVQVAKNHGCVYEMIQYHTSSHALPKQQIRGYWRQAILLIGPEHPHGHPHQPQASEIRRTKIIQQAALSHGLEENFLVDYRASILDNSEDKIISILLSKLPNLKTLYMVYPDQNFQFEGEGGDIQRMINKSFENENSTVLKRLETLYMISALHIGPKGHREYELELEFFLPFLRLPNLHSVFTLGTYHFEYDHAVDYSPLIQKSNIKTLSLDEVVLGPVDAINVLKIPTALENLRLAQEASNFSCFGVCYAPFMQRLGSGLQAHKRSLVHLDIDIRHANCRPYGISCKKTREPKDGILLGSLTEFEVLKKLEIGVDELCGHPDWIRSPIPLVDLLPKGLESLILRVVIKKRSENGHIELDNQYWIAQVLNLLEERQVKLPGLKKLGLEVIGRLRKGWGNSRLITQKLWGENDDGFLWHELKRKCEEVGITFTIVEKGVDSEDITEVTYFRDQVKGWIPGLD